MAKKYGTLYMIEYKSKQRWGVETGLPLKKALKLSKLHKKSGYKVKLTTMKGKTYMKKKRIQQRKK